MSDVKEDGDVTALYAVCEHRDASGLSFTNPKGEKKSFRIMDSQTSIRNTKMGDHWKKKHGEPGTPLSRTIIAVNKHGDGTVVYEDGGFKIPEAAQSAPRLKLVKTTARDVMASDAAVPTSERIVEDLTAWLYAQPDMEVDESELESFHADCFIHSPLAHDTIAKKTALTRFCTQAAAAAEKAKTMRDQQPLPSVKVRYQVVHAQIVDDDLKPTYPFVYDDRDGDVGYSPANTAMVQREREPKFSGFLTKRRDLF